MQSKNSEHIKGLSLLYSNFYMQEPYDVIPLPQSGSSRLYFRIQGDNGSVIGAFNADVSENNTFFYLTNHFLSKGLNVPSIIAISGSKQYYLISDLGDTTLYSKLSCHIRNGIYDNTMMDLFKSSLNQLVKFQADGVKGLDFSHCYPKQVFDRRSVMWDLNYFKYSFLKPLGVVFDEDKLESDFEAFADYLLDDDMNYFHYRDFQSRNIMVKDNNLYFIDFQGGRRGPCLYDVASFLYQAKAAIPQSQRDELFDFYLKTLSSKDREIDVVRLKERFPVFVLFRVVQTLGAYGFRGYFEGKSHFLLSIPPAIDNLKDLLKSDLQSIKIKYFISVLDNIVKKVSSKFEQTEPFEGLTIEITSFSLKNGYPVVNPKHGGGFIFDCRFLPNPGRLARYKDLTGLDVPVADYLNEKSEVSEFMEKTYDLVKNAIDNYLSRGFSYLSVGYGCTGGQHRSVYFADRLARMLEGEKGIRVKLNHRELSNGK